MYVKFHSVSRARDLQIFPSTDICHSSRRHVPRFLVNQSCESLSLIYSPLMNPTCSSSLAHQWHHVGGMPQCSDSSQRRTHSRPFWDLTNGMILVIYFGRVRDDIDRSKSDGTIENFLRVFWLFFWLLWYFSYYLDTCCFYLSIMLGPLKKRKRLRVHGFLARKNTVDGSKVLAARRRKGRYSLAVSYAQRLKNVRGKSRHHNVAWGNVRVITYPGSTERFRSI